MDWPNISVLIPTYNRVQIVTSTVAALKGLLIYSGSISFWLGVDNDNESAAQIKSLIMDATGVEVNALDGPRRKSGKGGLGGNLNMLLEATNDKLLMQMDDDHLLVRGFNLDPHVEKLLMDETCGWIRLMGIGFHNYCGCLEGRYWRVNWDSPELYITSNRPHIKHRRFHDYFGVYTEGLRLGETEEAFCWQCKNKATTTKAGPQVLVPLDVLTESSWDHIGRSFQLQGE